MRTSNTFSVLFLLDTKKAINDHAILYARVTVHQKRVLISLKLKDLLETWDSKKQRVGGKTSESKQINQHLDLVRSRLFQCYQELSFKGTLMKTINLFRK